MTKAEFLKDVEHEVEMLKKHATKEELNRLDFVNLDPADGMCCIYGQATGHCRSNRAQDLILKCCKRVVAFDGDIPGEPFSQSIKPFINGAPSLSNIDSCHHISSIESYIMLKGAKNQNIIKYLKGETKTLTL